MIFANVFVSYFYIKRVLAPKRLIAFTITTAQNSQIIYFNFVVFYKNILCFIFSLDFFVMIGKIVLALNELEC